MPPITQQEKHALAVSVSSEHSVVELQLDSLLEVTSPLLHQPDLETLRALQRACIELWMSDQGVSALRVRLACQALRRAAEMVRVLSQLYD